MRVVFAGSPPFATSLFAELLHSKHGVAALVTPHEKPKGRGLKVEASPLVDLSLNADVPVLYTSNANDPNFIQQIRELRPDVLVVASFGQLLKEELLTLAPNGALNVHASLLPKYRGASPVARAILEGDAETGVAIQRMVKKLDAGAVGATLKITIREKETAGELTQRLAEAGATLLVNFLTELEAGRAVFVPQDETKATICKKLTKEDGEIDWRRGAKTIERFVRAMSPWPGAHSTIIAASAGSAPPPAGVRVRILETEVKDNSSPPTEAGRILGLPQDPRGKAPQALDVTTSQGILTILRIQPEGGKALSAAEFLRGKRLVDGSRMQTAASDL
ncbi:MAG: methionyl-tRNA formyltransferase [Planctomycetota bacterium]